MLVSFFLDMLRSTAFSTCYCLVALLLLAFHTPAVLGGNQQQQQPLQQQPKHQQHLLELSVASSLSVATSAAAQFQEAVKALTYSVLVDSNGISHYVYVKKASGDIFAFVKALKKGFDESTKWRAAIISGSSQLSGIVSKLGKLQFQLTDARYVNSGYPTSQIMATYEDILDFIHLANNFKNQLLSESRLNDFTVVFDHMQRLVEKTERYAPVIRTNSDIITLFGERESKMFLHQRGCAMSNGRLIRSNLESQEIMLVSLASNRTGRGAVVRYGHFVALKNPKCNCFLTNADFDCFGTMAWDESDITDNELFRFQHPDPSMALDRPLRIGDRVVIQSKKDLQYICPIQIKGSAKLMPSSKFCEFQVRYRTAQIPQI